MQTSGLVLDVYDDVGGEQLKSFFSSPQNIPDFVKQAHAIAPESHDLLPDDAFALVLVDGGNKLRKYACIDEGNTTLSVLYFLKNAHKLPDVARVRAAENLKIASAWYGLDVPVELEKEALTANHVFTAVTAPSIIGGTRDTIKSNLAKVRAGESEGGAQGGMERLGSAGYDELEAAFKTADVIGTSTMPVSVDTTKPVTEGPEKTIKKTSHMRPLVDVTNESPRQEWKKKEATRFALPTLRTYPIDSYDQVKTAAAYFEQYAEQFEPVLRHEYCVNLVKRASELSIPLSDRVRKYGSEKYASAAEIDAALGIRRALLSESPGDVATLDKLSSALPSMNPLDFAAVLEQFDQSTGIHNYYDQHVHDPYYTTFGFAKSASEKANDDWSDVVGNYYVTAHDLKTCGLTQHARLSKQFGEDFAVEFKDDPVGIYNSLPVEQKILIIRLATDNSPV